MGSVAKQIGVPMTTVREWRRRHEFRASALAAALVALAVYLDSAAERGQLVRELASQANEHPNGSSWTYSRGTLDRWVRAYRDHGLDGLGLHHAPISASSVAILSYWRKPASCARNCQLAPPSRSARS